MKGVSREQDATTTGARGTRLAPVAGIALGAVALGIITGVYLVLRSAETSAGHATRLFLSVLATLLVAGAVAWHLRMHPEPEASSHPEPFGLGPSKTRIRRLRHHARWFVHMRWVAAAVSLALILVAGPLAELLPLVAMVPLLGWWGVLVTGNAWFAWRLSRAHDGDLEILLQAVLDLVVLTGWLNASGGIENPFYQAYLLHVIIAAALLSRRLALAVTLVAASLVSLLAVSEYLQIAPHLTLAVFPHGSAIPGTATTADIVEHAAFDPAFVLGRLVPFLAMLGLVSYLTSLIVDRLRQSEADLAQAALAEQAGRRRLEGVIRSAGLGVFAVARDLTVRWYDGKAAEWFGLSDASLGRSCADLGVAASVADLIAETARTAAPKEIDLVVPRPGGERRHLRHATWPMGGDAGVQQVIVLIEDVTARKALEAEAVHAGKLSALGRMAAAVAHEINNPLASLSNRIALMERDDDPQFWRQSLALIKDQIARITRIVRGVSQFGRAPVTRRTTWDVRPIVEEALNVVRLDPRATRVDVAWQPGAAPLLVTADRDQMVQVYLNLLINAVEAMPDGGRLGVRSFVAHDAVAVAIADSGDGVDEAVEFRLFEPFATTKPSGSGIGLAVSHALVQGNGGRIDVASIRGTGACFTVYLPRTEPPIGTAPPTVKPA